MIYSINQIKKIIEPVALKYKLPAVYLFGSYAKGEATENSDVDILVDKSGTELKGLFALGGLYNDLRDVFEKNIDLITTGALEQDYITERSPWFVKNIENEKLKIYG